MTQAEQINADNCSKPK